MNIRKFIAGVLACCIAGGAMPSVADVADNTAITASAVDEEEYTKGTYEQLKYKKYSDHIEISDCNEDAASVVIPAEIEGLPVTSIGYKAFYNCSSLTDITIPDSVTSIIAGAFERCSGLTSINIPDSVTSIEGGAFYDCLSLAEITIPDSVTRIGDKAFYNTQWLEEKRKENPLVIVNGILIDGRKCSGDVKIPEDVKSITAGAFEYCIGLTSITIPESITSIEGGTFTNCSALTSVTISESVTSIGAWAFSYCSRLTEIKISDSVTSIGDSAFEHCSSLTDITIPNSVTIIGFYTFHGCTDLKEITILNPECDIIYDYLGRISDTATIYGYADSTAQEYAEKYSYKFVSLGEAPETAGGDTLTGDANCDGIVDLADAAAIIQHIGNEAKYGLSKQGFINADCNADGKVTGADALAIQKLEAKIISQLPDVE